MRRHLCDPRGHHFSLIAAAAIVLLLLLPSSASAAPPGNDNRAAAEPIPAFPATIQGSTVDATVERLDPQVSECGSVESTVWYRIDQAPDGTIVIDVSGVGLAPVLRVYRVGKSSIEELVCASAKAGGSARVGVETTRGSSYLVLVGKKPKTADAPFTLTAGLFLPPANDTASQAKKLGKAPASAKGSTLGATSSENDPEGCRLSGGTVWYSVLPGGAERLLVRLQAQGTFDAAVAVVERIRSEATVVGCSATNSKGAAVLPVPVRKSATYLIVVGPRGNSWPGEFTLQVLRAQARERAPGKPLAGGLARGTLNGLTDVNDVWWAAMQPGSTYRIALVVEALRLDVARAERYDIANAVLFRLHDVHAGTRWWRPVHLRARGTLGNGICRVFAARRGGGARRHRRRLGAREPLGDPGVARSGVCRCRRPLPLRRHRAERRPTPPRWCSIGVGDPPDRFRLADCELRRSDQAAAGARPVRGRRPGRDRHTCVEVHAGARDQANHHHDADGVVDRARSTGLRGVHRHDDSEARHRAGEAPDRPLRPARRLAVLPDDRRRRRVRHGCRGHRRRSAGGGHARRSRARSPSARAGAATPSCSSRRRCRRVRAAAEPAEAGESEDGRACARALPSRAAAPRRPDPGLLAPAATVQSS